MIADDDLLTPAEVGRLLGVNPKTVSRWASSGKLNAIRTLGGHRRFHRSEVKRAMAEAIDADAQDRLDQS